MTNAAGSGSIFLMSDNDIKISLLEELVKLAKKRDSFRERAIEEILRRLRNTKNYYLENEYYKALTELGFGVI